MSAFDPRTTPARADLAAAHLRGKVKADRFVESVIHRVVEESAPLRHAPAPDAPLDSEALHGEDVTVYETTDEGWCWGQLAGDGYVGYLPAHALARGATDATHRIAVLRALVFPASDIKAPPITALPSTIRVDSIATTAGKQIWSPYFRVAFIGGAIAFVFPILILIGTATRLAAARREERYAALRLCGATSRQISVIAAVDSLLSALLGSLAGIGIFLLLRPALANTAITSQRYFANEVTPTIAGYAAVLVIVPIAAAVTGLLSLRRVRVSPLGVSRKVTPPPPSVWRTLPLVLGLALFVAGLAMTSRQSIGGPAIPGLLVVLMDRHGTLQHRKRVLVSFF